MKNWFKNCKKHLLAGCYSTYCLFASKMSDCGFSRYLPDIERKLLEKTGKKLLKKNEEWYITTCVQKSGKSREEIVAHMRQLESMGIYSQQYAFFECYKLTPQQIDKIAARIKKQHERIEGNKEKYLQKICEATGWSRTKADREVAKAKLECGASYEDYFLFKFYELPAEAYAQYVTYGLFSKIRTKYNTKETGNKYFANKATFNRTFRDIINRPWFVNRDISYDEFLQQTDGLDAIIVKHLTSTQGKGIHKFNCNVDDKKALYDKIMALPKSIVEQYIIQHPDVMAFCDTSVNTVRIATLNANGKCNFLYAVFRMGRGAVVDNFHAGGIVAGIDINTGVVITPAIDLDANVYHENPYSGLPVKGFRIPHWDKIIEACQNAYNRVPGVNLIGWDFAITPDGIELIEGNSCPSFVIAQAPFAQQHIGLRNIMVDPYL